VKRLIVATPYRWHTFVPSMVPLAAALSDKLDRARRARATPQSLRELATSLPPSEIEHHAPCPSCGADSVRLRYHPRFGGGRGYRVGQCDECDLLYRVPAVRPERVPDLYSTGTYADFLDGDYGRRRQHLYRYVLDRSSPQLDEGAGRTALDFGSGTGSFMEVAAERDTRDFPERLVARHHRAVERWDGANMLGVLATR
jgi:hypothetical protein